MTITRGNQLVDALLSTISYSIPDHKWEAHCTVRKAVIDAIDESHDDIYDKGYEDGWVAAHQELVGADNPPERTCKPILNPAKYDYWHVCGACHAGLRAIDNYCPNCGCRIESEQS